MEKYEIKPKLKFARPNYYQGILQLRDVNDEVMDFIYSQINKRADVVVTKTIRYPNGTDLYLTSQKFIRILGKKLKDSFGGELKVSSKLHTRSKTGKNLFRVNVFYRTSKYKRGDVVLVRGDNIMLLQVGRRIFARDLKTGRKIKVRSSDLP